MRRPDDGLPDLYDELAEWFYLLTAPEDYVEESAFYGDVITRNCRGPVNRVLELGSGGGNNASHLKALFEMTLVDVSPAMLEMSKRLNPECEHIVGDMRTVRLGRQFDAVFIHDAISYLSVKEGLEQAIETAFVHCRPGGVALFCPDFVTETFVPATKHGGHDAETRGMRYLAWTWDPDVHDTSYMMDMAYLLREGERVVCRADRHRMGLFGENEWLRLIRSAGFSEQVISHNWSDSPSAMGTKVFLGVRPDS